MNLKDQFLHKQPSGTKAELNAFANARLKNFFDTYPNDEGLENLWIMIQQSFYTKRFVLNNAERANLIAFYQDLHELILATRIINDELKRVS
ncbi:MAG: hypothetical protein P0Y49_05045 [Candidatus Pedobacter colombiensis]|uniref:Uncharacterized protein n=1 Tax=Candidatus Pedobacter colombiensis TaxID=3121371 RepID=A0AAJ5WD48_9SPHI|nr:hypothetical protein [Pedobacter sp.]WEK20502.1 MAG: hypothetical protein P0Y49_05045 [Pedobacter sp.]